MRIVIPTIFSIFILLISICNFIILPVNAEEDEYIFSMDIRVDDDSLNRPQVTPDVAVTSDGRICVVWMDGRLDPTNFDIFFTSSTDGGNVFGDGVSDTDVQVNDDLHSASQKQPAIATYGNEIYVVWTDSRLGYEHIYFSKSTNGGATFSQNYQLDSAPQNVNLQFPDIAVTPDGNTICVVWQDSRDDDFDIYYAESTDGGESFSSDIRVDNDSGTADQKYPRIAIGSSGDKYVVWQDMRSGNADIYFAHADAGTPTNTFDTYNRVDEGAGSSAQTRPTVGAYGTSNVYVAWRDTRLAPAGDIYFDKSTNKGGSFGTDKRIDRASTNTPLQDHPDMGVDGDGNIIITWYDKRSSNHHIYVTNSTDGGSTFPTTDIRVDDNKDSEKDRPRISVVSSKKFYITWQDKRNNNNDIYFSRWGKASEMVGLAPKLTDGVVKNDTTGDTITIAGVQDVVRFEVTYTDIENNGPATDYPKLYLYKNPSKTAQVSGSPFPMKWKAGGDKDYTNGEIYCAITKLTEEHNYVYQIEAKAAEGNKTLVQSKVFSNFKIDNTLPTFSAPKPVSSKWMDSKKVECSVKILDPGGSGVDRFSISYQVKKNGSADYESWSSSMDRIKITNGYLCKTNVSFGEGKENYIHWQATDDIAKEYAWYNISEPYEVKVDTTPVKFIDPVPPEEYWQNMDRLTCGITITDIDGSGVNASTIEYWYRPASEAAYYGPFSTSVTKNNESITVTTPVKVPFENGEGNTIKWYAEDLAGNTVFSEEFVVNIDVTRPSNVPPQPPTWIKPKDTKDSTPYIEWNPGFDEDDDELEYYIQIGTSSGAADILSWTSAGLSTHYQVNKNLIVGTYYIQIKVFDGLDNSSVFEQVINITATGGDPPKAPTAIYPDVTSDHTPRLNWSAPLDGSGQPIFYIIQIGTSSGVGDVLSWYPVGPQLEYQIQYDLPDGIYYVQLMSMTDNGTSASHEETIKIATFNPELNVKNKITAKQGENVIATINLKNNCSVEDIITINITSELLSMPTVSYSLNPKSPVVLSPYELKNITLLIQLPSSVKTGDYQIDFTAISEDGVSKSFTRTLVLNIGRADGKKPTNGDADGDEETEELKLAGLPIIVWILLIIVIIIIIGVAMAALSAKKKRDRKQKAEFFQEREEYEKLYGPSQGRGGGRPGGGRPGGGRPGAGGGTSGGGGGDSGSGFDGESDLDYYYEK